MNYHYDKPKKPEIGISTWEENLKKRLAKPTKYEDTISTKPKISKRFTKELMKLVLALKQISKANENKTN